MDVEREGTDKGNRGAKRPGRPTRAEGLGRTRTDSLSSVGSVEEWMKRKRDMELEEEGGEIEGGEKGEEGFKKSKKVMRSPIVSESKKGEECLKKILGEIKDSIREVVAKIDGVTEDLKGEIRGIKEEMRRGEDKCKQRTKKIEESVEKLEKDQGEYKERMKGLEKKIEQIEKGHKGTRGETEGEEDLLTRQKVGWLEKTVERKERLDRKKNVIIKGLEKGEKGTIQTVKDLLKEVAGKEIVTEEIKEIGGRGGGVRSDRTMALVKVKNAEEKALIMGKKSVLKGRKERIEDDLTWKERKMQWRIKQTAWEEGRKGKRVRVSYGRIRIGEEWWKWDEEKEELKRENEEVTKNGEKKEEGEGEAERIARKQAK